MIANRGIPARRISRAISERLEAIPILTTDVDKPPLCPPWGRMSCFS
ncbi:MAG: hypothetical protein R2874_07850 [Desulfobacterales bacterium]